MAASAPALVALTETHRTADRATQNALSFRGYTVLDWPTPRVDAGRPCGGLALCIAQHGAWVGALPQGALPQPTASEAAALAGTATQMEGALVRLHGLDRPVVVILVYVPPAAHKAARPIIDRRLSALCDWADNKCEDDSPYILMCGDFNVHHPALRDSDRTPPMAERRMYDGIQDLGFVCANAVPPARGVPTHVSGGVLDLVWERQPTGRASVLCGLRVDAAASGHLLSSDHFPVRARLAVDRPAPASEPPRMVWKLEGADPETGKRFVGALERRAEALRSDPGIQAMHMYVAGGSGPSAQTLVDSAEALLVREIHGAAGVFPRQRLRQGGGDIFFPPNLRAAQKAYRKAVRDARADPADAVAHSRCVDARELYTEMYKEVLAEHWRGIKQQVELQPTRTAKARVAFKAVRRVLGRGRPFQTLAALREPAPREGRGHDASPIGAHPHGSLRGPAGAAPSSNGAAPAPAAAEGAAAATAGTIVAAAAATVAVATVTAAGATATAVGIAAERTGPACTS